MGNWQLVIGNW